MDLLSESQASRTAALDQLRQLQGNIDEVATQIDENQQSLEQNQAQTLDVQEQLVEALESAVSETLTADSPPVVPWCATAGAFADPAAASSYVAALGRLGIEGEVEARREPVSSTWWVYMPAFNSETAATATLQELQDRGIDSYYMRTGEGDMAGGISLGVYSRRDSALIGQQQLATLGYATSITEVERLGERYYVALRMLDGTLREGLEWAGFLASNEGPELAENACQMIAPENQVP
jgi:cell division septation protein DedD